MFFFVFSQKVQGAAKTGCQINCYDRGRLTIPLKKQEEEIQLEYYDGKVRGRRCQRDRNSDLHWQTCSYTPEGVIGLIERLKNTDVTQTPPDDKGENAQA